MSLDVRPLSTALGAEVVGLDLTRPLEDAVVAAINAAFLEHQLLCFRSQPLPPADFARLARYLGEPQLQLIRKWRDDEVPEVTVLESTYHRLEDKPDDRRLVRLSGWHTDDSYFAVPAKATMLQGLALPETGGETRFLNIRKAWEDLPQDMQAHCEGLQAVHGYDTVRAPARATPLTEEEKRETPDVVHPLIRTHEETGRKAIYVNTNRTDRIVGMERAESDALLDALVAHITDDGYRYDHPWRRGDILLWDNRCLLHSVNVDFPVGQKRLHQRILLEGTKPV